MSRRVDSGRVSLLCTYDSMSPSHSYFVSWYEDNRLLKRASNGNDTQAVLTEQELGVLEFGAKVCVLCVWY